MLNFKTARARNLRKQFTDAENILWFYLRDRRFLDLKFRRQYSVGSYFLDFFCPQLKLGIEVDGGQHYSSKGERHDRKRNLYLKSKGITIFRYSNHEVIKNTKNVIEDMLYKIRIINSSPYPLLREERGIYGGVPLPREKRDNYSNVPLLREKSYDYGDVPLLREEKNGYGGYTLPIEKRYYYVDASNNISSFDSDKQITNEVKNKEA